jgi:hypothetical protein
VSAPRWGPCLCAVGIPQGQRTSLALTQEAGPSNQIWVIDRRVVTKLHGQWVWARSWPTSSLTSTSRSSMGR